VLEPDNVIAANTSTVLPSAVKGIYKKMSLKNFLLLSYWAYLLSCQLGYEGSQYTFTCHTERRKTKKELGKVLIAGVRLVPKRKH
jgi:hypothetical protein